MKKIPVKTLSTTSKAVLFLSVSTITIKHISITTIIIEGKNYITITKIALINILSKANNSLFVFNVMKKKINIIVPIKMFIETKTILVVIYGVSSFNEISVIIIEVIIFFNQNI